MNTTTLISLLLSDRHNSALCALISPTPRTYTPFGYTPDAIKGFLIAFNGEPLEQRNRHYLLGNGYRAYNPILMRFNSPDNLSPFRAGGLNSYAYCNADPMNNIDPTGHEGIFKKIAGKFFWSAEKITVNKVQFKRIVEVAGRLRTRQTKLLLKSIENKTTSSGATSQLSAHPHNFMPNLPKSLDNEALSMGPLVEMPDHSKLLMIAQASNHPLHKEAQAILTQAYSPVINGSSHSNTSFNSILGIAEGDDPVLQKMFYQPGSFKKYKEYPELLILLNKVRG